MCLLSGNKHFCYVHRTSVKLYNKFVSLSSEIPTKHIWNLLVFIKLTVENRSVLTPLKCHPLEDGGATFIFMSLPFTAVCYL